MVRRLISIAVIASAAFGASPALANGCNGVVNPFVWGCAPWDHNNGPQFAYYRRTEVKVANGASRVQTANGAQMINVNGQMLPVIRIEGANVVAAGGANVVAPGGANLTGH